jgi:hypothetical protein
VKASHDHVAEKGGNVAWTTNHSVIEFDVAVTTTEAGETKKGGGIFVGGVGIGAQGTKGMTNSSVSRVKFSISVTLPQTPQDEIGV